MSRNTRPVNSPVKGPNWDPCRVAATKIEYARVSTDSRDLSAQWHGLEQLGVDPARIYTDDGLTGTNRARPGLREAMLKGQRRVHMKKESDQRRRVIADAICGAGVTATVYDADRRHRHELDARGACLRGLIEDAAGHGEVLLVLEQDDSLVEWDRRSLFALAREAQLPLFRYGHRRAANEQLSIPDAIARCWARGGQWRHRIEPAVTVVRSV